MTTLGQCALWGAFLCAGVAAMLATLAGAMRRSAWLAGVSWALNGAAVLSAVALGVLARLLLASDFSVRYVATFTAFSLPDAFKLGAIASGPPGVLLLWSTGLTAAAGIVARRALQEERRRGAMLLLSLAVTVLFALLLCVVQYNPFTSIDPAPIDGLGMEPELQRASILLANPLILFGLGIATTTALVGALTALDRLYAARLTVLVRQLVALTELVLVPAILLGLRAASQVGVGGFRLWDQLHFGAVIVLVVALVTSWATTPRVEGGLGAFARRVSVTGALVALLGLMLVPLRTQREVGLRDGQSTTMTDRFGRVWTFTSQGTSRFERPPNQYVLALSLAPRVGSRRLPLITAEQREYLDGRGDSRYEPMMTTGRATGVLVDAQLALLDIGPAGATMKITLWPLRVLLEIGASMLWIGALLRLAVAVADTRDVDRAEEQRRDAAAEAVIARWSSRAP